MTTQLSALQLERTVKQNKDDQQQLNRLVGSYIVDKIGLGSLTWGIEDSNLQATALLDGKGKVTAISIAKKPSKKAS